MVLTRLCDLVPPTQAPKLAISRPAMATGVASHPVSSRIGRCLCHTPSAPGSDNCLFFCCFWPWPTSDWARFSKGEDVLLLCVGAAEASPVPRAPSPVPRPRPLWEKDQIRGLLLRGTLCPDPDRELGAAVPVPASWRITARDLPPPAAREGVSLRQTCCSEIDVHQHVK